MGRTCSMHGTKDMHVGFWWESQKEIGHCEDTYVSGKIILKWFLKK
jgi:hypothetical protein